MGPLDIQAISNSHNITHTLTIERTRKKHAGQYQCQGTDKDTNVLFQELASLHVINKREGKKRSFASCLSSS